jgi:hypothetical protein
LVDDIFREPLDFALERCGLMRSSLGDGWRTPSPEIDAASTALTPGGPGRYSLLWGNPQWQIEAFRKFQIPDQLVEGHGYPKLTPEIKAKVFGLNAARLWGLKPPAGR